jgi:phosphatidylglycerophosphate synthase
MESIKELKIRCQEQKTTGKDFNLMLGYLAHRRISIYLTKFLLVVWPSIRPDFVSLMMIFVGLGGAVLLSFSEFSVAFFGVLLVYFSFLLDKVDGEIARYKQVFSLRGIYLDELYHILIPSFLLVSFLASVVFDSIVMVSILAVSVFLNLLNRYNRKIPLIVFVKENFKIMQGIFREYGGDNFVKKFFNSFLFKIPSILERFDLIILTILAMLMIEKLIGVNLRLYYLYAYFLFAALYFIRWTSLNYFGNLDKSVGDIKREGY